MKYLAWAWPSPSMGVAFVALLVAMGGTGYATIVLPANSVGSKQLKNKAVNGKKIATNAISSGKVKNGSLLGVDFQSGQLPSGPQGPRVRTDRRARRATPVSRNRSRRSCRAARR